ncbi:MAG: hypothetical protein GKR94_08045 [Gammaproteobacteria bacterium]|nr:hypothetical protein [Gammaproteobacteria bacterium]
MWIAKHAADSAAAAREREALHRVSGHHEEAVVRLRRELPSEAGRKAANAKYAQTGGYRERKVKALQDFADSALYKNKFAKLNHEKYGVSSRTVRYWLVGATARKSPPTADET